MLIYKTGRIDSNNVGFKKIPLSSVRGVSPFPLPRTCLSGESHHHNSPYITSQTSPPQFIFYHITNITSGDSPLTTIIYHITNITSIAINILRIRTSIMHIARYSHQSFELSPLHLVVKLYFDQQLK